MIRAFLFVLIMIFSHSSHSEELTEDKKRVIDELLEITGALEVGEMMGNAVAGQMIQVMSQQGKGIDQKVVAILKDEIGKIMHEEFIANRFMHEISYSIYHKYFSTNELKEVVAFYKTSTGSKMAKLLPQITQESMVAGQQRGASLGPLIQARLAERFKKEGIN